MARKARQRISYVLPLASSASGHRLGVNGLAVDRDASILYSGGRDGAICAWDLGLPLKRAEGEERRPSSSEPSAAVKPPTTLRQQVQAHTHWINDIVLVRSGHALVSASSDLTVKVWRPGAGDGSPPRTIGLHNDYVKCLASPSSHADWVASGGLDHKIRLWDLNGGGESLQIAAGEDGQTTAKSSVYALAATASVLASGGPESVVRVWDPRSGKGITKFVGHTDNIRDILIAQDGDTIMTASSDQTVKVWSMTAGRCMNTLTMHNDSVWSLYSEHPELSLFYSSDRSGLVAKTDARGRTEVDQGVSVAVCQEHEGVAKVINVGDYIWTATSSSSINRWEDVDTEAEVQVPESYRLHRSSVTTTRSNYVSMAQSQRVPTPNGVAKPQIPLKCILRLSHTSPLLLLQPRDAEPETVYPSALARKGSDAFVTPEPLVTAPFRSVPDATIEGQHGLIKHVMLNDRRRVLTVDTAGEVMLWDLLQCIPIESFGKRHLDDVLPELRTTESVAHWCAVDTRIGNLTCVLEENFCFDAEIYADELRLEQKIEFREDQRINLGKWVLRYLFSYLIDEEIKRDETFRQQLLGEKRRYIQRDNAPSSIHIPLSNFGAWQTGPTSKGTTPRANATAYLPLQTPGMAIGLATPAQPNSSHSTQYGGHLQATAEEEGPLEQTTSNQSQSRPSSEKPADYFSTVPHAPSGPTTSVANGKVQTPTEGHEDTLPQSPTEQDKDGHHKDGSASFGKKFRMTFGMKKLAKSLAPEAPKPSVPDEKSEDSDSRSSKVEDKVFEDNFFGVIQRIRHSYEEQVQEGASSVTSEIRPSLPNDTPVLKPPLNTMILIQEDRPDQGGVADLFKGTVGSLGQQADAIEKAAPPWLGDLLLRNHTPPKEIVKVSFVLEPYQSLLPSIAAAGFNRLNANRMLRARKILQYVAERIEAQPEDSDPNALKPEEYLDLYCQNQLIPPLMTLATIRAHVWRGGGDVLMYYKANGRKRIKPLARVSMDGPNQSGITSGEAYPDNSRP